jgi:hypothetical protein
MLKPTTALNTKILDFVMNDPKVQKFINGRDSHKDAFARELRVTFERQLDNPKQSGYRVDFTYNTRDTVLDKTDDVIVYVIVTDGAIPSYKIANIIAH